MAMYAACSLGKCPQAFTTRQMRTLTMWIALVEQITRRSSGSKARKGTNSAHALSHTRTIVG